MPTNTDKYIAPQVEESQANIQPDESGGLNIRGLIKIYDPETEEVFVINNDA